MSQALPLYRLQQIDQQLDRTRTRLEEIKRLLGDETALTQAIQQAQTAREEQEAKEAQLKKAENEVNALRIKIEQTEASLYGGAVRNPKELQDLQNDAASMKRYLVALEDRLLEAMAEVEEAQAKSMRVENELHKVRSERETQTSQLRAEQADLERKIQKLNAERLAVTETLAPEMAALYEELRRQRRGVAVSEIRENACGACGTSLSPAQVQAARSPSQLSRCPSCGRILYAN